MTTLEGRTALITGAGRGLGREHAIMFADLGANVVVNDNGAGSDGSGDDAGPAAEVVREIKARGGEATAHVGSVSDWNTAKEMVDLAVDTYGKLDILVNNAGILRDRMLVNMSEAEFDSVIDVHLKGHFCPSRHAAAYWRDMAKAGTPVDAAIINTSSGSGLRGNPGQTNYAAAKAGIAIMTVIHARELERYGVRVNAIAPIARTRLTEATPGLGDRINADGTSGFDKWSPENISPLVAWLALAGNKVSGQVFGVFGGHIGWQQGWVEQEAHDLDRQWQVHEIAEALAHIPAGPPEFSGVAS
ncbi:NAD(P)-dependent dehydrogenase (short-subunit alcohol dehydrogenase family) [Antricoccus suffuscus]|uniref:NAD(P)-dependent dehydrogenase (Short-subunit alcohol dehydrogenase family) n=1 Tax=Antricoccus suffuscus TaxID=1629062 RepID=A0A2T1A5R1_9ACTN|nr:SDR family oxidoreductase [Antricoccus suffuscus]PRZ43926.1 NAD(P)-dependent dehydrogenase (short-subunit alcohol dehydrogenase family) [Antricoccus suffuscus]